MNPRPSNSFDARIATAFRPFWPPVALAALCLAFQLGGDSLQEWGSYQRTAVQAGDLWRFVTAHLVHLGWFHLWLNLAALAVIALLFEGVLSAGDWLAAFAVSAAGIDVGLYLDQPAVQWYVGLSGVLHGIVAFGALRLAVARSPIGVLLCVGLAAKLGWEHWVGPLPFSAESTGGAVLSQAHVYGTFAGASLGLAGAAGRRLRRRRL